MIPLSYKSNHPISTTAKNNAGSASTPDLLLKTEAISHIGSWELNLLTQKLIWSDEYFRISGCEPRSFEPNIDMTLNFFHVDDRYKIKLALDQAIQFGNEFKIETRIVRPDNSIRFVISQGIPSFNNDQIPERIFGILHDITEEKETALALEENRQIYKSLFEQNPQAVYSFDLQGKFLSANEVVVNLTDCSIEELLKISFIPFINPEDLDMVMDHFLKAGNGEVQNYNARVVSAKGRKSYINISNFPIIVNDTIIGVHGVARDITRELTNHLEVQHCKEELGKIMDYSKDVICTFDEDGYFQKVGAACEKVWGYKPEELIGARYIDLVHSDDVALTNQIAHEIMTGKVFTNFENRYIRKDQSIVPIIWSARWDRKDKVMYCIAGDASEQKKAERNLEKSKQKVNNVLDSITDGFYILDKDWLVTYFNKEAENILNLNRGDVIGRNIWETFSDLADVKIYEVFRNVMNTRASASVEEYFPDLTSWLEINVYPFEDGISVYFKQINERKIAAESIRIAKERYDLVAKATNDTVWDWEIKTNNLYWGDGFHTLFGYDVENVLLTLDSWVVHIHPSDLKRVSEKILKCVHNSPDLQWEDEYQYIKSDGTYAFVFDRGFIIRDENGIATRMIGAMQDISERKRDEQKLKDLNVEVKKRAEELAKSNTELEQFAYIASHDLQEPLRMVTGFLTQLEKKYSDQLDDKANQYIYFAVDGAKRMREIITDLLEYSRVGRNGYDQEEIDLDSLLIETIRLNKVLMDETGAFLEWKPLPKVLASKTQLQQVFQNIIINALKYKNPDFVPIIRIEVVDNGNNWLFSFADNGIGIDEQFFTKIFVLFRRLHTKEEYPGTGIGLAICKKIVESHSGKIWVESVIGSGSTFYFTISKQYHT